MKWKCESTKNMLIEVATDADGNRYQIMARPNTRLWQTFKNGTLVSELPRTRRNAKALVDKTIEPKEDLRKNNGRHFKEGVKARKPRRTPLEISMGKDALCSRCGARDKEGAVVECSPTQWEPRSFSYCMACLTDFAAFNQPIKRENSNG